MRTVLVVTNRKTGTPQILMGPETDYPDQIAKQHALHSGSDEFSSGEVFYLTPCKPKINYPLKSKASKQ